MKVQNAAQKKVKKTDNYKEANNREDNFTDVRMYGDTVRVRVGD